MKRIIIMKSIFKASLYARTLYDAVYIYLKTINRTLSNGGTLDDICNGSAIILNSAGTYDGLYFIYGYIIDSLYKLHK